MLEIISMKINFWFAALSPFVSAVVAVAMMRGSWNNPGKRFGASIWDIC
jgi:hypothetical protein